MRAAGTDWLISVARLIGSESFRSTSLSRDTVSNGHPSNDLRPPCKELGYVSNDTLFPHFLWHALTNGEAIPLGE